jgi:hypothetical protein
MQVINIPTMKSMIHHVGVRKRRPLMFWGPMGVGKTEAVEQSAAEHDATLVDERLSQYESVDFRGIPDVVRTAENPQGSTVWNMPATLPFKGNPKFNGDEGLIYLFLDEINSGHPSVLAVCYQLLNQRRVGEHELMDNVVILAAGNRESDRGVTNRMPAPLLDRLIQAELVADIKPWSFWAQKSGKVPPVGIAYLNFQPEQLHTFDPSSPEKTFASPRSWEYAFEFFTDPEIPEDVKTAAMSGAVGEARVTQFMAFVDIWGSLTPIADIIANPDKVAVPDKLDVQYAMAVHVSGHMDKDNVGQLQRYLDRMAPEFVVLAWTLAINRDENVTDSDAFLNAYAPKYRSLFN